MSAAYDAELCARLAKEARAAANSGLPGGSGLYGDSLAAMADQLEAAQMEIERLRPVEPWVAELQREVDSLRTATEEVTALWYTRSAPPCRPTTLPHLHLGRKRRKST